MYSTNGAHYWECGLLVWDKYKKPVKRESHVVVWSFQTGQLNHHHLYIGPLYFVLYKCIAAGHSASAVRNKGLNPWTVWKGCRGLRWREEACANQLWLSVSCWDLHRERGCSCSLGRSVKSKKIFSHYLYFLLFLSLLIFMHGSTSFSLSPVPFLFPFPISKSHCSLSYHLACSLSD